VKETPVYKQVAKGEQRDTPKLVRPETNEFSELLLALSHLILLYFLLGFVFESLDDVFLNLEGFFDFITAVSKRLYRVQLVHRV
jgi:hypothetical protein